jgi:hypothetical protein
MDLEPIRTIQSELAQTGLGREIGATALTVLSMGLSAIPIVGGPLSYLSDRVRSDISDPDLASHIKLIANVIESLAPDIAKIDSLELKVASLEHLASSNTAVAAAMKDMIDKLAQAGGLNPIFIESNGGTTHFTDNIIRNMHLHSVAREGGRTVVDRVDATGSAKFQTLAGSTQHINKSIFSGGTSSVRSTTSINNAIIHPGATVETSPPGQNVGTKITYEGDGAAMTIGPNGIEFGKR